jgi:hypothetical protein
MLFRESQRVSHEKVPKIKRIRYVGDGLFLVAFSGGLLSLCDVGSMWGHIEEVQCRLKDPHINENSYLSPYWSHSADFTEKYKGNMVQWVDSSYGDGLFLSCWELYKVAMDYDSNRELYDKILSMDDIKNCKYYPNHDNI